jgi:hypothetical protein
MNWRVYSAALPGLSSVLCSRERYFTRAVLLRWAQVAFKPAFKSPGLHRIFIRGKRLKYVITHSALKRVQVDAQARWCDAGEQHLGLTRRTGGTLNFNERHDGRKELRPGHDASLE